MTQYMMFDWGVGRGNKDEPLTHFLGTVSELPEERPAIDKDENGFQNFGFANIEGRAKFSEYLMQGRERKVIFVITYDHMGGIEKGSPILALYPILTREEYIEQGYTNG